MSYIGDRTTGFASPAQDHTSGTIQLADVLDLKRPSRYPVRVEGNQLATRGILDSDVLIVDSAHRPTTGAIVVAQVGDEMRIAELILKHDVWHLRSSRDDTDPVPIDEEHDVTIFGVVTGLVRGRV